MSAYQGSGVVFEILDHGGHELELFVGEIEHGWIEGLLLVRA